MKSVRMLLALLGAALLSLGVAACGGTDKGEVVNVEVGEASASTYFVKPDRTTVGAGKVTFAVTNVGALYHEFIVYSNVDGVAPGDLPVNTEEDEAELVEENVIGEAPYATPPIVPSDKKPGDADHRIRAEGWGAELTVDLEPGKYVLLCNLEGHYTKHKQYTAFTVE